MNLREFSEIRWIEFTLENQKKEEIKNKLLNNRINEQLVRKFLSSLL